MTDLEMTKLVAQIYATVVLVLLMVGFCGMVADVFVEIKNKVTRACLTLGFIGICMGMCGALAGLMVSVWRG